MRKLRLLIASFALSAGFAGSAAQADVAWRFISGADYSTGKYGEAKATDVLDLPFTVKATTGSWTFRATAQYLFINGPADVAALDSGQGGPGDTSGAGNTGGLPSKSTTSRSGFGDSTLAATYSFRNIDDTPIYTDLTGSLRLPTGNEHNGTGVGAYDKIANVEVGAAWKDYGAYVSGGRRFLGQSSLFQRHDTWQSSVGGWYDFADGWEAGSYYYWQGSAFNDFPGRRELGACVSTRIDPQWRLQLLASKGFSIASADWNGELTITYRPNDL